MIKITSVKVLHDYTLALTFSDGSDGAYDMTPVLEFQTVLTEPLREPAIFAKVYLELGAICWPNGLELSPHSVYETMEASGRLVKHAHAA